MMENQTQVKLNRELAQMLKGGVIMDVTTPEQVATISLGVLSVCISSLIPSFSLIWTISRVPLISADTHVISG